MKSFLQAAVVLLALLSSVGTGQAETQLTARISGAQEVRAVATNASGLAVATLTDQGLSFRITVNGLSGPITGAHFHNAAFGVNGGIVRDITFTSNTGNTAMGTWPSDDTTQPLTAALVEDLLAGNLYINVHTGANPNGEIRGQVLPPVRRAALDGAQEVGPVTTDAAGQGLFTLTPAGLGFDIRVNVDGLSGPIMSAHFHNGAFGVDGPIVRTLTLDFVNGVATGIWTSTDSQPLTPALIDQLKLGNLYINVHTALNGGGEIRGQIVPPPLALLLDGAQEVPPVPTNGSGVGLTTLTQRGLAFDIVVDRLSGPITGAHFHNAPAGVNGGIVRAITEDFVNGVATGIWTSADAESLTAALIDQLERGNLYVNVHTGIYGTGEIRGQIMAPTIPVGFLPSVYELLLLD